MLNIIPQPKSVKYLDNESFSLDRLPNVRLILKSEDERLVCAINTVFPSIEPQLDIGTDYEGFALTINFDKPFIPGEEVVSKLYDKKEGYFLKAVNNTVVVHSRYAQGFFYGIQTLRQILEFDGETPAIQIIDWPDIEMRCTNFDLRQIFPKFERIIKYIGEMARFKINTLLVEYEDKLPFNKYPELRHVEYSFTDEQLDLLKETAKKNFIEIIPLQQTFGHLEYLLKHDEYKQYRECHEGLGEICPSKPMSFEILKDLLSEMLDKHPDSRYIHIGCDEVYNLCKCEECKREFGGSENKAFLFHVNKLIEFVVNKGRIPIIWHDMLSNFSGEELNNLDKRAVVMIWLYYGRQIEKDVFDLVSMLRSIGIEVMGASALRCYGRRIEDSYPDGLDRSENVIQWAKTAKKLNLNCVVSTNWTTNFGMGFPYGLFETVWHLIALSAEMCWNSEADTYSFLSRFINVFFGVKIEDVISEYTNCDFINYYEIIRDSAGRVRKNNDIAHLIEVMHEYEEARHTVFYLNRHIFRLFMYKENEAEIILLRNAYQLNKEKCQNIKSNVQDTIQEFIPEGMVQLYMNSRFFVEDFLEENIYKKFLC